MSCKADVISKMHNGWEIADQLKYLRNTSVDD